MKVKDCMCSDVFWIAPNTSVNEAAKIMGEKHVGCLPVCDENQNICGIVTDRDILLRVVANDKDTNTCQVSEIMTSNVFTCKEDDEMTNAQTQMKENQIRRLPVCDSTNKVVGILTLGNIAQNDTEIGKQQVSDTLNAICDCQTGKNSE